MRISVRVKPGVKGATRLEQQEDGSYVAFLHARAHDGEANKALIELISDEFKVPKTTISIAVGQKFKSKTIEF
ncbi:MAG: DUF167 domain-containing protein [Candidatus Saccharibacteria bacterium]|nr:DUF167 domain-containing protein [Candidatus Saccharibacteria bacterium]